MVHHRATRDTRLLCNHGCGSAAIAVFHKATHCSFQNSLPRQRTFFRLPTLADPGPAGRLHCLRLCSPSHSLTASFPSAHGDPLYRRRLHSWAPFQQTIQLAFFMGGILD